MANQALRSQLAQIIGRTFVASVCCRSQGDTRVRSMGLPPSATDATGDWARHPAPATSSGPGWFSKKTAVRARAARFWWWDTTGPGCWRCHWPAKDHSRDGFAQVSLRRQWTDIGSGLRDRRGRASAVRVDRILRVDPAKVRRQGAVLQSSLQASRPCRQGSWL